MMSKRTPDAKLLKLEAEFNAAADRWDAATARRVKAEKKEAKQAAATVRARDRVMRTRAKSLEGLAVKVRVRDRDYTDAEDLEIEILKSIVADIKAIVGAAS
ncbi:hypothetical protein [Mesorhizobium sp.]|uniref:hypothetical protein n=1 Tax=Mesorhizobium sp. TaxID=1871066 RepID=UPI000FE870E6|nr:hypothetical protein [Mesorhizobium sp.]RWQ54325.1 MAG: hypothetical protein EOS84_13535 [Mesorhizobium sp.]